MRVTLARATGAMALLSNPVTAIAGTLLQIGLMVWSSIKKHHAQAVATEAGALNYAAPSVENSFGSVVDALNSGSINVTTADNALDSILQQYQTVVYKQYGVKQKSGNGPDVIYQSFKNDVAKLKALFASGKAGSVTLDQTYAHAGYAGTPAETLSYSPSLLSTIPSWVWWVAGGLLLLWLLSK